ncbi:hypothetical protein [Alkalihalobacillus deserti]|uniref:hypothetical protein n=1 Tax=Alkalihalobacillus deserti TaxID=2879466 RepID=UPI001D1371A9|nr:hypothetical protein [Alkalihalobacillus deserti]
MDEFEKMMAEFDEWAVGAKEKIKASGQMDQSVLDGFVKIIAELVNIKHDFGNKLFELRAAVEEQVVRLEYSKGGETIHRGFYCPSLVQDIVVGGAKRGRLFKKKIPEFGNYSYEYGFDKDGRLLRIKGMHEFSTPDSGFDEEFLLYNGNVVYGLEFTHIGELELVSRCFYDNGKLLKYERSQCGMEKFADLHYEEYTYDNNRLTEVALFYNITPQLGLYEEQRLRVENDEDGNMIKLTSDIVFDGKPETFVYRIMPRKK